MPDVFVPNDTVGISSYYINVLNAGLLQKFAFQYTDRRRETLSKAANLSELLRLLLPTKSCCSSLCLMHRPTECRHDGIISTFPIV